MDDLTVKKLEEAFSLGCSDLEACLMANISKQTLYNYQDKNPEFVGRKERLKETPILLARNTVIDYYRKVSSKGHVPLEAVSEMESSDPLPEDKTEQREELERLRLCFGGLDEREQELISLKFAWELNNRNIAPLLSLSESNVGTILYRAILKLRKCIEDWINGIR